MSDNIIQNRYDFVYFFDVEKGNPNGDPDAGNMPRIDPETGHGMVTDVSIKRKIRNYMEIVHKNTPPYKIFIREKAVLNRLQEEAYKELSLDKKDKKKKSENAEKAREWMCRNYYDVRTFGAVMTTGDYNCGQVTGPVQITFARSVEPIVPLEISITRMAVTREEDEEKERTMGRKHIIPYALYRAEGFISPHFAAKTGFSVKDLQYLWEALWNMYDHDHSAARGKMNARKLIVFKHESKLGNAPSHELFNLVRVEKVIPSEVPARRFEDYRITIQNEDIPENIQLITENDLFNKK